MGTRDNGVKSAEPESLLPIHDEVFRLTQLVSDLHQLTIAEAGKLTLHKQLVDVSILVQRIVENFQVASEDRGVAVQVENRADHVSIAIED